MMTRTISRNVHRRYLMALSIPACLATALFSSSFLFLKKAGEYDSVRQIVDRQLDEGGVYNSGVGDLTYEYKLALFARVRPDVVVVGSSRAMQFHGAPFRVPFVNLGGAMNSLGEGEILLARMLARHRPRLVIIVLDFWWFNDAWEEPESYRLHGLTQRSFLLGHLYKPLLWLLDGKVSPATYFRVLTGEAQNIGTQAVVWRDGYDRFGATHYPSRIDGTRPHKHKQFQPALRMISQRAKGFVSGRQASPSRLNTYQRLLSRLERQGIAVVTVLPPLAPTVRDGMLAAGGYDYIDALRDDLRRISPWFVDAHDARALGSSDCEFLDGTHGGAVTYLRILNRAASQPKSPLAGYVVRPDMEREITNNVGHAAIRRADEASPNEMDFLDIGCKKARDGAS